MIHQVMVVFACLSLLSLPLWPAVFEALWPSDEKPLEISRTMLQDPRGAQKQVIWRYCLMFGLDSPSELGGWLSAQEAGELKPGVLCLGAASKVPDGFSGTDVLSTGSFSLAPAVQSAARIFSARDLTIGAHAEIFEVHAVGELRLDPEVRLQWWGTGSLISLGRGVLSPGALRAEREIRLEPGARFHVLNAPWIRTVLARQDAPVPREADSLAPLARFGTRKVFDRDYAVAAGETVQGDLIVRGDLRIGAGARVLGSVKAHGSVVLGEAAGVAGSVVAQQGAQLGSRAWVGGCVLGEIWVKLESGARVGRPGAFSTVSSESVNLAPGATVHGMVRAWKGGYVTEV